MMLPASSWQGMAGWDESMTRLDCGGGAEARSACGARSEKQGKGGDVEGVTRCASILSASPLPSVAHPPRGEPRLRREASGGIGELEGGEDSQCRHEAQ